MRNIDLREERKVHGEGVLEQLRRTPLPEGFLFGVSSSGYQVEGGFNEPGCPLNNWWEWECANRVERSGRACSFWERPYEHIELASSLGLNAFRLGLEWSRLQPSTTPGTQPPPPWDGETLRGYARIIRMVQERGMLPVVTLLHFTHPAWLGRDFWLRADAAEVFARYCEEVAGGLNEALIGEGGEPVRLWITLNEPNALAAMTYLLGMFPSGKRGLRHMFRALDGMFAAHALAYDRLHDLHEERGWGRPLVSYNTFCLNVYELDRLFADLLRARGRGVKESELHSYGKRCRKLWTKGLRVPAGAETRNGMAGKLLEGGLKALAAWKMGMDDFPATCAAVYSSRREEKMDYLGLDVYDPLLRDYPRWPSLQELRTGLANLNMELWQQVHDPGVFGATVKAWALGHEDLPIYILENGMCTRRYRGNDWEREDGLNRTLFLRRQLAEVARLLRDGLPLRGYFYWSLTDNYEWGSYQPRFGLFAYDYEAGAILPRDCLGDDAGAAYGRLIEALRGSVHEEGRGSRGS